MPRASVGLFALNRGEVSALALARVDVERLRLSAERQVNWLPRVLGPMMLRPGTAYIGETKSDKLAWPVPFIYARNDTALIELTDQVMRVWVNDALVTRGSVSTTVTSGDMSSGTGWTLAGTGAATATVSGGFLNLTGANGGRATGINHVTVSGGDVGKRHALRIVVERGPVLFRCGSSSGDDSYVAETELETGTHSLAFTPSGDFYIWFANDARILKRVSSSTVEAAGVMELPTPWVEADLPMIRHQQSADVIFVACKGYQQRRIERRDTDSWSVVLYRSDDGPFTINTTGTTLTPAALAGNTTLTASSAFFKSGHVGALFRLFHSGQHVSESLNLANTYTSAIRVTGTGNARIFTLTITGTWVGTLKLQRSFDGPDTGFVDWNTYTTNASGNLNDGFDNSITWIRVGFKTGAYTSGTASIVLDYGAGGGSGICRVLSVSSSTVANIEVLSPSVSLGQFKNTTASETWYEGTWSDVKGWPTAVALHEGRMWWAGSDRIWGSISDDYASFDLDKTGDAGPIDRSIGSGPIAVINSLLPMQRLILSTDTSQVAARSSSFDEPLTPTNFVLKDCCTQAGAPLQALKLDTRGLFVEGSGRRVYELAFDVSVQDYKPKDLTRLNPDIGIPGFVSCAIQRQPDTNLHFIRTDGQDAVLLYDSEDGAEAWWRVETDGLIERVVTLPGTLEDQVYYIVNRTINGSTKRFWEKMARIDECQGEAVNKQADCHIIYSGPAVTTITGLSHLEGKTVVIWGDGKDLGTATVSSGQIVIETAVTDAVVGLGYEADFLSSKLAYAAAEGTALNQVKRVNQVGFIMASTHYQGIMFGSDTDHLDDLPLVEEGAVTPADTVWGAYDHQMIPMNGSLDTDSRICIQAFAPRPATVMGVTIEIDTHG